MKSAIRYFGDYVLLGEIARGGMGVVYRALQTSLDREVAIKMIDAGKLASEAAVRRFHTEAEAMAKLDHPNIVSIHEIGEHDGQHYFTMKLVDGVNLAEHIGRNATEPRRAAELLITIAHAVQYAHDRGVLHRDLKPSNILLDENGRPHITDFGIAKLVQRDGGFTGTVAALGTPEYMAPEQAAGKTRDVGTAADIYSLGAVLYHLLTGRAPFRGDTPFEILDRVVKQTPAAIRSFNSAVDHNLETICLKCLEKEPGRRYGTAEALALDLQRWLSSHPIQARAASARERTAKWVRRQLAVAPLSAFVVLAIGFVVASLVRQWDRSDQTQQFGGVSNVTQLIPGTSTIDTNITNFVQQTMTNVVYLKTSASGTVRERRERIVDGEQIESFSFTGRLQRKETLKADGTKQTISYDTQGREKRQETLSKDGGKEIIMVAYDRNGKERARETLRLDAKGRPVAKTVVMQSIGLLDNQIITNHFDHERFGFVYSSANVPNSSALLPWPTGSNVCRYAWGWNDQEWFRRSRQYFVPHATYPSLAHWLTDWLIGGYLADDYATDISPSQLREEARLAREEVQKAKKIADLSKDLAEIREARAAQTQAELPEKSATEKVARIEGGTPRFATNLSVKLIDGPTKQQLRNQIEKLMAVSKGNAEAHEPLSRNLSQALTDLGYIFFVSKTISVVAARDHSPAGVLRAGDLLKLDSSQSFSLSAANENTFASVKVIASQCGEGEVASDSSIMIALRDLQEFDSEFRLRIDLGLTEAREYIDAFVRGSLQQVAP